MPKVIELDEVENEIFEQLLFAGSFRNDCGCGTCNGCKYLEDLAIEFAMLLSRHTIVE
jgi:hypothetical protein